MNRRSCKAFFCPSYTVKIYLEVSSNKWKCRCYCKCSIYIAEFTPRDQITTFPYLYFKSNYNPILQCSFTPNVKSCKTKVLPFKGVLYCLENGQKLQCILHVQQQCLGVSVGVSVGMQEQLQLHVSSPLRMRRVHYPTVNCTASVLFKEKQVKHFERIKKLTKIADHFVNRCFSFFKSTLLLLSQVDFLFSNSCSLYVIK